MILDTKYNSISYDDLAKPYEEYQKMYDKVEADYSTLLTQTKAWEDKANRERSPEAYAKYKQYITELQNATDNLLQNGYTPYARKALMGLKGKYFSEIGAISAAETAREAAEKVRSDKGEDAIFERSDYDSIDDFLHGQIANNNYISYSKLMGEASGRAKMALGQILRDPEFLRTDLGLIVERIYTGGGSYDELMQAISENPAIWNRFTEVKNQLLNEVGYKNFDAQGRQRLEEAVNSGLFSGLYTVQNNVISDPTYQRLSAGTGSTATAGTKDEDVGYIMNPYSVQDTDDSEQLDLSQVENRLAMEVGYKFNNLTSAQKEGLSNMLNSHGQSIDKDDILGVRVHNGNVVLSYKGKKDKQNEVILNNVNSIVETNISNIYSSMQDLRKQWSTATDEQKQVLVQLYKVQEQNLKNQIINLMTPLKTTAKD